MLADAIAAEAFRLRRSPAVLFWGFLAVPLAVLLFNLLLDTWVRLHMNLPAMLDMGRQTVSGVGLTQSAFFQIFYAAAAASLFAADYRWETWRLLTPRNSRVNLIMARFAVYGAACAASLILLGVFALVQCLYAVAIGGAVLVSPAPFALPLLGTFLTGWCELMVLGAIVAIISIATRAATGALMTAMAFCFGQWLMMVLIHPWQASPVWYAALPRLSAWMLRAFVTGQEVAPGLAATPAQGGLAALCLLIWMTLGMAVAAGLFRAQELTRE